MSLSGVCDYGLIWDEDNDAFAIWIGEFSYVLFQKQHTRFRYSEILA